MTSNKNLVIGTSIVGGFTLVSRVLGFVRDLIFARFFGANIIADAFVVAFRIPNLLRSILAEGALTSAFVPVFAGELAKSKEDAQKVLSSVLTLLGSTTSCIAILGIIYAPTITELFAPGFGDNSEKAQICIKMTRLMFPYIMCVSTVAMVGGALTAMKFYGSAAISQVVMNLVMIVGTIFAASSSEPSISLGLSVAFGGVLQILIQIPALRRAGFKIQFSKNLFSPPVIQILKLMVPAIFGAAIYQISIFLNTVLASLLGHGAVSHLFYADRIVQLPVGIFTLALATVMLPVLSTASAQNDMLVFHKKTIDALRFTSFVILPCSVFIYCFAQPLVKILFERGEFNETSTFETARVIRGFAIGIWGVSMQAVIIRTFLAKKDTTTSTVVSLITMIFGLALSILMMGPIDKSVSTSSLVIIISQIQDTLIRFAAFNFIHEHYSFGAPGLALASGIGSTLGFFILLGRLKFKEPGINYRDFLVSTIQGIVASFGIILVARYVLPLGTIVGLLSGVILAPIFHLFLLKMQKSRELQETFSIFLRKHR